MNRSAHSFNRKRNTTLTDIKCNKIRTKNKLVQGKQKIISMMRSRISERKMVKIKKERG